jgi:CheY-like chemotaxis protein
MNSTYIISDFQINSNNLINQLQIPDERVISLRMAMFTDKEFHNWTSEILKNKIEKLIIPLNLNTEDPIGYALKIAMHIRLNYEFELSKRNIPFIFLSDIRLDLIIKNYSFDSNTNLNNLFFTKGVYLSSFDTEKIKDIIEKAESCLDVDTKFEILDRLKFSPKATSGKHSLANAWGCFKLSQILNLKKELSENTNINEHLNTLYAKYLICLNNAFENKLLIDQNPLNFSNRKILVIDDQSDEGWSLIYNKLFFSSRATLTIIDPSKYKNSESKFFHDFQGFYNECLEQIGLDWDLIILDLRLHPELEDLENQVLNPIELSGYKLLDAFLNNNRGYQIIISTASNKIWNINAALDRGAKSYYIKESPEYNYSLKETRQLYETLKKDVESCFKKNYLRTLFKETEELKSKIQHLDFGREFKNILSKQLDLAFEMIFNAKNKEQFAFSFVTLYLFIEEINKQFVEKDISDNWVIKDCTELLNWAWDKVSKEYKNTGDIVNGNKPPEGIKFAGIYFQKWHQQDNSFVQKVNNLISERNYFIHNDSRLGKYYDIFNSTSFLELFECIKVIVDLLK